MQVLQVTFKILDNRLKVAAINQQFKQGCSAKQSSTRILCGYSHCVEGNDNSFYWCDDYKENGAMS